MTQSVFLCVSGRRKGRNDVLRYASGRSRPNAHLQLGCREKKWCLIMHGSNGAMQPMVDKRTFRLELGVEKNMCHFLRRIQKLCLTKNLLVQ